MSLWAVRHAQPLVAPGICYGVLDMPADAQATRATAEKLAAMLPASCSVRSSTLQRCEQLAQALSVLRPDLMLKLDPRLREMDFGSWEGQRWDATCHRRFDADTWVRLEWLQQRAGDFASSLSSRPRRGAWRLDPVFNCQRNGCGHRRLHTKRPRLCVDRLVVSGTARRESVVRRHIACSLSRRETYWPRA